MKPRSRSAEPTLEAQKLYSSRKRRFSTSAPVLAKRVKLDAIPASEPQRASDRAGDPGSESAYQESVSPESCFADSAPPAGNESEEVDSDFDVDDIDGGEEEESDEELIDEGEVSCTSPARGLIEVSPMQAWKH